MHRIKNNEIWEVEISYCSDGDGENHYSYLFLTKEAAKKGLKRTYKLELEGLLEDRDIQVEWLDNNVNEELYFHINYEDVYIDGMIECKKLLKKAEDMLT